MAAAALLTTPVPARAASSGEHIDTYEVDLAVRPDGSVHVAEQIRYDFGTGSGRHGIDRWIPERARYDSRHDRILGIGGIRVTGPYGPAGAARVTEDHGREDLRIGDPGRTVSGTQTYDLDYDVARALTRDAHGVSLVWNALGTSWRVPVTRAVVTVRSPVPVTSASCVAGREHGTAPCAGAAHQGTTAAFVATGLRAHRGVTVRVGLPKDSVPVAAPRLVALDAPFAVTRFTAVGGGVAGGLLVLAAWWFLPRRRRGRGRPRPDDPRVPPGLARVLVNDRRGDRFGLDATLADLAVRGHLRFRASKPRERDYCTLLDLEDATEEGLLGVERRLLSRLFWRDETVNLDNVPMYAPQLPLYEELERSTVEAGYYRRTRRAQSLQATVLSWTLGAVGVILLCLAFTSAPFAGAGWVALTPVPIVPLLLVMGRYAVPRRAAGARAEASAAAWRARVAGDPPRDPAELSRTFPYAVAFQRAAAWATPLAGPAMRGDLPWFTVEKPRRRALRLTESEAAGRIGVLGAVWPEPVTRRSGGRRTGGGGGFTHSSYGSDSSFGGGGGGMSVGDGGGGGGGGSW